LERNILTKETNNFPLYCKPDKHVRLRVC